MYLGSFATYNLSLEAKLNTCIGKASGIMSMLNNSQVTVKTKAKVYHACVINALLYGSESWTVYSTQERHLNSFHLRCYHCILGISWWEKCFHAEVLEHANITKKIFFLVSVYCSGLVI